MIEAVFKSIALGFFTSSYKYQKGYILQFWNVVDFGIIALSIFDMIFDIPKFEGLANSFKCIRAIHLLKLFKKNDLLDIIVNTMYRCVKPIIITLVMTWSFIFIYGLIGVNLFRG